MRNGSICALRSIPFSLDNKVDHPVKRKKKEEHPFDYFLYNIFLPSLFPDLTPEIESKHLPISNYGLFSCLVNQDIPLLQ